jgi:hypothetical protein
MRSAGFAARMGRSARPVCLRHHNALLKSDKTYRDAYSASIEEEQNAIRERNLQQIRRVEKMK